jgi:hypothetical protein
MARVFKAPGIKRQEIDLSEILVPVGISNGAVVIRAKKGPVNRTVLVSNDKEFIETFGEPTFTSGTDITTVNGKLIPEYGYGAYAALEFLKESSSLYVVRDYTTTADTYAFATYDSNAAFTNQVTGVSGAKFVRGNRLDAPDYISIIDDYAGVGGSGASSFVVAYKGPGADGNSVAVTVEPFSLSADWKFAYDDYPSSAHPASAISLVDTEIERWYPIASQVFKLNVYVKDTAKEWQDYYRTEAERTAGTLYIAPVESFYGAIKEDLKDGNKNDLFIENIINGNSKYIYVKKGTSLASNHFAYVNNVAENTVLPDAEDTNGDTYVKYNMTTSGSGSNRLSILAGGASKQTNGLSDTDGWVIFEDRENANVNILIGTSYVTAVKQEIGRIAAVRADCIAVVPAGELDDDTTAEVKASEIYGYRGPSYVAIYAGFSKIFDTYNDKYVYLPNSIYGAELMARTDNVGNPWDAPAGTNRGILPVVDQRKVWTETEIGELYDFNINVPKLIRGSGHTMWGNKTSQMKKSALDRINVRRNLLYIENNIEISLFPFMFENNTARTRLRVFNLVDSFLSSVQAAGGLTSYKVVCDESNNPSSVIDANQLNVDIYVAPGRTIEFIQLTTIVTRTNISFEEVQLATA